MAVQYSSYKADPNGTPQINGAPGFISAVQKGYQLAQLPEQMKQEALLRRSQAQKAQVDAKYAEPEAQGRIAQSAASTADTQASADYRNKQTSRYDETVNSSLARDRALNANTYANTSLTNTQNSGAQDDLKYQRAFYAALQAAQNGQEQPQPQPADGYGHAAPQPTGAPQYQPGQGGAPLAAPQGAPTGAYQGQAAPSPQGGQQPAQQAALLTKVVQPGNASQAYLDDFAANPLYAGRLEKMGIPGIKTSTHYDSNSGQLITTTQYPSGKVTSSATPLTEGGNGTTVSYDDNGKPIIQIGGKRRSGSGGLALDGDGNVISMPTNTTQTNLQQRSIGEQVAQPFLKDITSNLPQFQNIGKRGLTNAEGVLNQFGADFDAPSQKAKGEAAITLASEGLLKSFGLFGAHANLEEVKNTLQPKSGESVDGYKRRIVDYADTTISNAQKATKNLAGIKIGQDGSDNTVDSAKVKHLTDNYSLEQLKQMQSGAK